MPTYPILILLVGWLSIERSVGTEDAHEKPLDSTIFDSSQTATHYVKAVRLVEDQRTRATGLERLGWFYINKARLGEKPAVYHARATACLEALAASYPERQADALLLRGHLLHQQHRFAEALRAAEELVRTRGNPFDHALRGDVLLDLGRVQAAAEEYQVMLDLRPGLPAYLRGAELRWMMGDSEGALELLVKAVTAGSSRDPEGLAWALCRLSHILIALNRLDEGILAADRALALIPGYPQALAVKGRALLGQDKDAVSVVEKAVTGAEEALSLWLLWEAYDQSGRKEASGVERRFLLTAPREDARTASLYLATRGIHAPLAVKLARENLEVRQDVFSHDALAWALWSQAQEVDSPAQRKSLLEESWTAMESALALGTDDGRLWFHAARIASDVGRPDAQTFAAKAHARRPMLLPSEKRLLDEMTQTPFAPVGSHSRQAGREMLPQEVSAGGLANPIPTKKVIHEKK